MSLGMQYGSSSIIHGQTLLALGDYVYFGQYNGQPILWRVIKLDDEGDPLLFSENILSYKAFDAAEKAEFTDLQSRQASGSNRWYDSSIREWLNSKSNYVTYTTAAPASNAVLDGFNAYDQEPGFLYSFTSKDREAIKPVLHKELLSQVDESFYDGGSELHSYTNTSVKEGVANYDSAYFEQVQDSVFLLSIKELAENVADRGWSYKKSGTSEALQKDESGLAMASFGSYWLSTPSAENEEFVRYVYDGSFVYYTLANDGSFGVCPALYLDLDLVQLRSGAGSSTNPFVVEGINEPIIIEDANLETAIRQNIDQPSGDIMLSAALGITQLDANGRQIESLEGIQSLSNLEELDISYNKIKDVTPLRSLKKLRRLYAQYNEIEALMNLFYNDEVSNSPLEEINIVGNNMTISQSSTTELSDIENGGITVVSKETEEVNSGIEVLVTGSEGKAKQEIAALVDQVVKDAGRIEIPATGNEIILTSELLKGPAEAAMKVAKQTEKALIEKEMSLNRTIKSVVEVVVTGIDWNTPFIINLDPTILTINQADEITIKTDTFTLAFSPTKLVEDFRTTQNFKIIVQATSENQEIETIDDLSSTTHMGQFAQQLRAKSEAIVKGQLSDIQAEETLYNGLLHKSTRSVALYGISFEKDGNIIDQIESSILIGLNASKDPDSDCIFMKDETQKIQAIGGQYNAYDQKMIIATQMAGKYYVLRNNQYYRDIGELTDEEKVAIHLLSAKSFLEVRSEREFAPDEPISREELATAIVKMTYLYDESADCDFIDVSRSDLYYHYIASSKEKGIINGYPDNSFKPDNAINYNEIVKINAAILAYDGYIYPSSDQDHITFTNKTDIKAWVTQYLSLLIREEGFLLSVGDQFIGDTIITRKDAALLLYKLYKKS